MENTPKKQGYDATSDLYFGLKEVWPELPDNLFEMSIGIRGAEPWPTVTTRHHVDDRAQAGKYVMQLSRFRLVPLDSAVADDDVMLLHPRLRMREAQILLQWMSVTAGAAKRGIDLSGEDSADGKVHAAIYRTLKDLAHNIVDDVGAGPSLASRVIEAKAALARNTDDVTSDFRLW